LSSKLASLLRIQVPAPLTQRPLASRPA
jgi:hypothetical protein